MQILYHGTIREKLESIWQDGLQPKKGAYAMEYHCDASALVYAVDNPHSWRMVAAMIGQMIASQHVEITDSYQFEDFRNDIFRYGAVIVFHASTFIHRLDSCDGVHPCGAEKLDWYSREAVGPGNFDEAMTGQRMLDCLRLYQEDFRNRRDNLLRRYKRGRSQCAARRE
jgi:hypothetical protein